MSLLTPPPALGGLSEKSLPAAASLGVEDKQSNVEAARAFDTRANETRVWWEVRPKTNRVNAKGTPRLTWRGQVHNLPKRRQVWGVPKEWRISRSLPETAQDKQQTWSTLERIGRALDVGNLYGSAEKDELKDMVEDLDAK